jgi:hypothetical protein
LTLASVALPDSFFDFLLAMCSRRDEAQRLNFFRAGEVYNQHRHPGTPVVSPFLFHNGRPELNPCGLGLAKRFSSLIHGLAYLLLAAIDQFPNLLTRLLDFCIDRIHSILAFSGKPLTSLIPGLRS